MITKCQTLCERGGTAAAGIGVGFNSAGGDVTIYGGAVKAHGGLCPSMSEDGSLHVQT